MSIISFFRKVSPPFSTDVIEQVVCIIEKKLGVEVNRNQLVRGLTTAVSPKPVRSRDINDWCKTHTRTLMIGGHELVIEPSIFGSMDENAKVTSLGAKVQVGDNCILYLNLHTKNIWGQTRPDRFSGFSVAGPVTH